MNRYPIIGVVAAIVILAGIYVYQKNSGNLIDPSTIITPSPTVASDDLIRITFPKPGDKVSSTSPLTVKGEARGSWYVEGSFPITLVNWDGLIIGENYAQAKDLWTTTEYVPFEGTIIFEKPDYGKRGSVIFRYANPSDDPVRDKAVEIPIEFI